MITKPKHNPSQQNTLHQESEIRYQAMIEASPVSIMTIRAGCFLSVNPAGCRMLGYASPEELVGMPALDIVASESKAMIAERINRLDKGLSNPASEINLIRKNGEKITVESSSVSILIDGENTAMVFAHDISHRKKTEKMLRDSEARLNAFMDHYPANIYIKDSDLRHVFINRQLKDYLGVSVESFRGTTSHDFFPPEVANRMEKHDRMLLSENVINAREIERTEKNGTRKWFNDLKFPIQLASGETLIGGISTDITERKQAEKKIEELRQFENLLFDISTSFIDVPIEKIDQYINQALEQTGRLLGFDRCSLGNVTPNGKEMRVTHVWNHGPISGVQVSYPVKQYPWLLSPFATGNALLWNRSMGFPDGSEADIRLLEKSGMQAFAGIPVKVAGELKACLGFSNVSVQKQWEPELVNRLDHLSRIFGNVLSRKQADEELQMMQYSVDHSLDRIAWIAPDGRFLYANEASCQEMHFTLEEILSMNVSDVGPDFSQEKWNEHFHHLKKIGSMRLEVQQVDGRGKVRDIDVASTYNNFGSNEFICSFARDITELRKTEQALIKQIKFERLISELTSNLAQTNQKRLKETIYSSLENLGQYLETERCFVGLLSEDHSSLSFPYVWAKEGFTATSEIFTMNLASEIQWVIEQIRNGEVINTGPDLSALPDEAQGLRLQLKRDGINSGLVVPMKVEGNAVGILGLDTLHKTRSYEQSIIDPLMIIANLIGTTFKRIQAENDLKERLAIEDLISNLSATFVNIKASEVDRKIEHGLGVIAKFLDVDRGSLFQFSQNHSNIVLTHSFNAEGVKAPPRELSQDQQPWFISQLIQARLFYFSSPTELPEEATAEKAYLKQEGVQSAVILPLMAAGVSHGCIVLSASDAERRWPKKVINQLSIISEVFSNALMRKRAHDIIESRLNFEGMLTSLATRFINLSARETDNYLKVALERISEFFGMDRSSILQFDAEMSELRRTHMWERIGIQADPHGITIRVHEQFPILFKRLKNAETIIVADSETIVDDDTAAYCRAIGIQSFIMLPLIVGRHHLGSIVFSVIYSKMTFTDDQVKQFRLFSTMVANALTRQLSARALEESQLQTRQLAGRILSIQENERKRLARELHDDLSQRLAVMAMSTSRIRADLEPLSTEAADSVHSVHRQLVKISEDVHAISRQLHPSILEDLGLEDAVRNEINAFHRREGIHIDYLSSGIPDKLPKDVSLCFFRIIQESLRNIAKHARTNSASITLTGSTDHLDMDIRDHGCGFDQENTRKQLGLGLISIGERVRMVDGKLEITSSPGQGTRIQVSAPIAAEGKR